MSQGDGKSPAARVIPFTQALRKPPEAYIAPHHEAVEATVLAASIMDPGCLVDVVASGVDAESFYLERHRQIWTSIETLFKHGTAVDPFSVIDAMGISRTESPSVWDEAFSYLSRIQDALPSTSYLSGILDRLHAYKVKRALFYHSVQTIHDVIRAEEVVDSLVDSYQRRALSVDAAIKREELTLDKSLADEVRFIDSYNEKNAREWRTGFPDLDKRIAVEPPALIIVAGYPSSGKTAFALNVMLYEARRHNVQSVMFSIDNSEQQVRRRFISIAGGPPITTLLRPYSLTPQDKASIVDTVQDIYVPSQHIVINHSSTIGPFQMWASLNIAKKRYPNLRFFVVDYIQVARPAEKGRNITREREVGSTVTAIKSIARKLGLIAIVLSQLTKRDKSKGNASPSIGDLRDTGQLEQDADIVLMLHRDSENVVKVDIAKNKDGPTSDSDPGCLVGLHFEGDHLRFSSLEYADVEEKKEDKKPEQKKIYKDWNDD